MITVWRDAPHPAGVRPLLGYCPQGYQPLASLDQEAVPQAFMQISSNRCTEAVWRCLSGHLRLCSCEAA
jgi:hypothetical protein